MVPNSFYKASISLIPKPEKSHNKEKRQSEKEMMKTIAFIIALKYKIPRNKFT
jgi:hypothetical protein